MDKFKTLYNPSTSINIRPATIQDFKFIVNCMDALDESQANVDSRQSKHYTIKYYIKRNSWAKKVLLGEIPNATIYIIDGKGFAAVSIKEDASEIHLDNFLILSEYRGTGLGSFFLQWLQNYRDLNYPTFMITLGCLSKNLAAQSVYEANGFVPVRKDSWAIEYRNEPKINKVDLESKNFSTYDPPMSVKEIKINYSQLANKLLKDPVHCWRAETGIELIHREPSVSELERIWENFKLMPDNLKRISDKKSFELFGMSNEEHYYKLKEEMNDSMNFSFQEKIRKDSPSIRIRNGNYKDKNWIISQLNSHFKEQRNISSEAYKDLTLAYKFYKDLFKGYKSDVGILVADPRAGFLTYRVDHNSNLILICDLFIEQSFRGNKVASKLVNKIKKMRSKYLPDCRIQLSCLSNNLPAQTLYKKLGFYIAGKEKEGGLTFEC